MKKTVSFAAALIMTFGSTAVYAFAEETTNEQDIAVERILCDIDRRHGTAAVRYPDLVDLHLIPGEHMLVEIDDPDLFDAVAAEQAQSHQQRATHIAKGNDVDSFLSAGQRCRKSGARQQKGIFTQDDVFFIPI